MPLATFYTPVDESAELPTFANILHEHALASPHSNLFLVPNQQDRLDWSPVKYGPFDRYVTGLSLYYKSLFRQQIQASAGGKPPVVNLLVSPAENLFGPLLGLNAAGVTVIPTNPFLPSSTVLEIAKKAGSTAIVIGGANMQHLLPATKEQAAAAGIDVHVLEHHELLSNFSEEAGALDNIADQLQQQYKALADFNPKVPDPAIIMHSTGSTNLPKLIPWQNRAILNQIKRNVAADGFLNGQIRKLRPDLAATAIQIDSAAPGSLGKQRLHDIDLDKERVVFISKEPFAIAPLGIVLKILFLGLGWVVAFPRFKSTQFTVPELLKDLYDSHSLEYSIYAAELTNIAHYFQEKLSGEEADAQQKYLDMMRAIGPIPVGGSRVERSTAKACISLGIRFQVTLGTTESGFVLYAKPNRCEKAWGKPLDQITERDIDLSLGMQLWPDTEGGFDETQGEQGQGELWIGAHDLGFSDPSLANDGKLWRTRDLFSSKELVDDNGVTAKIWEYFTRKDDMVMLGNGENLAPNALEDTLRDILNEHLDLPVTDILICGTSRPVPAILLETTSGHKKRVRDNVSIHSSGVSTSAAASSDAATKQELMKRVVEVLREPLKELTATLPSFFPLREDRIVLLPADRKLPRSVKDVVMRGKAELLFAKELDELYFGS